LQGEIERTVKLLVDQIPEKIKDEIHDRLLVAFKIKKISDFP